MQERHGLRSRAAGRLRLVHLDRQRGPAALVAERGLGRRPLKSRSGRGSLSRRAKCARSKGLERVIEGNQSRRNGPIRDRRVRVRARHSAPHRDAAALLRTLGVRVRRRGRSARSVTGRSDRPRAADAGGRSRGCQVMCSRLCRVGRPPEGVERRGGRGEDVAPMPGELRPWRLVRTAGRSHGAVGCSPPLLAGPIGRSPPLGVAASGRSGRTRRTSSSGSGLARAPSRGVRHARRARAHQRRPRRPPAVIGGGFISSG
jgi:hypothetical protein